jgi:hypothetical protein
MAWQADIISTERNGTSLEVRVNYSDGVNKSYETIRIDGIQEDGFLEAIIVKRINELTQFDAYAEKIATKSFIGKRVTKGLEDNMLEEIAPIGPPIHLVEPLPESEVLTDAIDS